MRLQDLPTSDLLTNLGVFQPDKPPVGTDALIGAGTVQYMPSDQFENLPSKYGDIYSLAFSLYEIVTGKLPISFTGCKKDEDFQSRHRNHERTNVKEYWPEAPQKLSQMFEDMWAPSPPASGQAITADEVVAELEAVIRIVQSHAEPVQVSVQSEFIRIPTRYVYHPSVHFKLNSKLHLIMVKFGAYIAGDANPVINQLWSSRNSARSSLIMLIASDSDGIMAVAHIP